MRDNNARRLDLRTLETMRERVVRQVQEGESPEVIARVLGLNRSTVYGWLARYRRGRWNGSKAKPLFGRPPKLDGRAASQRRRWNRRWAGCGDTNASGPNNSIASRHTWRRNHAEPTTVQQQA